MGAMKNIIATVLLPVFIAGLVSGCAAVSSPVTGGLYTNVKGPVTATANATYSKVGSASASSVLGIVATGDASIEKAAKNGGITKIHHVDFKSTSVLFFYSKYTVIVYGE